MHDPLDDLLRETLEGAETNPAPDTWEKIRRGMGDQHRPKYLYLILALLILGAAFSLYTLYPGHPGKQQNAPVVDKGPQLPIPAPPSPSVKPDTNRPDTKVPSSPEPILSAPVVRRPSQHPDVDVPVKTSPGPVSLTIPVFLPDGPPEEKPVEPIILEPVTIPAEGQELPQPELPPAPKGGEPQSGRKPPGLLGIIAKSADVVMGDLVDYTEKEKTNGYDLKVNIFGKKINISKN